jgi:hypothetical protein
MTSVYKEKVGKVKISENQLVTKSIETLVEKTLPYNVCVEEMGKTESLKPSVEIEDKTKHSDLRTENFHKRRTSFELQSSVASKNQFLCHILNSKLEYSENTRNQQELLKLEKMLHSLPHEQEVMTRHDGKAKDDLFSMWKSSEKSYEEIFDQEESSCSAEGQSLINETIHEENYTERFGFTHQRLGLPKHKGSGKYVSIEQESSKFCSQNKDEVLKRSYFDWEDETKSTMSYSKRQGHKRSSTSSSMGCIPNSPESIQFHQQINKSLPWSHFDFNKPSMLNESTHYLGKNPNLNLLQGLNPSLPSATQKSRLKTSDPTMKVMTSEPLKSHPNQLYKGLKSHSNQSYKGSKSHDTSNVPISTKHLTILKSKPHDVFKSYKHLNESESSDFASCMSNTMKQKQKSLDLEKIPGNQDIEYDPTSLWVNTKKISLPPNVEKISGVMKTAQNPSLKNYKKCNEEAKNKYPTDLFSADNTVFSTESRSESQLCSHVEMSRPKEIISIDTSSSEFLQETFCHPPSISSVSYENPHFCMTMVDNTRKQLHGNTELTQWGQQVHVNVKNYTATSEHDQEEKCSEYKQYSVDRTELDSYLPSLSSTERQTTLPKQMSVKPINNRLIVEEIVDCLKYLHFEFDMEMINDSAANVMKNMCNLGDSIVSKLVLWTRHLPFYKEIPVEVHSQLLTEKWHKLLLLVTSSQQVLAGDQINITFEEFHQQKFTNVKRCLNKLFDIQIGTDKINSIMVEFIKHICKIMFMFNLMTLKREEYACLQAILLLNQGK